VVVGIGIKESGGEFTEEIAYRVFVTDKRPPSELSDSEVIPPEIDGIKTDVLPPYRIKDRPDVCGTERRTLSEHRPLHAGIAISPDAVTYGTLGWFGTLDVDDSRILLTNKHVLWDNTNETRTDRKPVAQPQLGDPSTCCCCECGSDHVIGETLVGIRNMVPITSTSVDCALAKISAAHAGAIRKVITNDATDQVMSVTGTAAAVVGAPVRKIGARSGFTRGTVVHIGDVAAAPTDPAGGTIAVRTGQVLAIPDPAETYQVDDNGTCKFAFSNNGDSGALGPGARRGQGSGRQHRRRGRGGGCGDPSRRCGRGGRRRRRRGEAGAARDGARGRARPRRAGAGQAGKAVGRLALL
jgi:hypothetical protein